MEETINIQSLKDFKEKIKTKVYKEIEELRKNDHDFSFRLEKGESELWEKILRGYKYRELHYLVKIYDCLNSLNL